VTPYYEDDSCVIYHEDCRELLPSLTAAVVVTDPPYGIGDWRGKPRAYADDWMATEAAAALWPREAPCGVFANHASLARTLHLVSSQHERSRVGVWHKANVNGAGGGGNPWLADVEFFVLGVPVWPDRPASGLVSASRSTGNPSWQTHKPDAYLHPSQKPVAAMCHVIRALGDGAILDPFMGSGTTLRAAKDLGRKAIRIEIEERYCEIAAERLGQEVFDLA
jgi:site-specific DNA-methyltransferase (adenine-specific)